MAKGSVFFFIFFFLMPLAETGLERGAWRKVQFFYP
jgi:hypothetical protein